MRFLLSVAILVVLFVSSQGRVLYERYHAPKGWTQSHGASKDLKITYSVALKQQNTDLLEQKFWDVSNPDSPQYQNFMEIDEIMKMIAPKKADHESVVNWLHSEGVKDIIDYKDGLRVTSSVEKAEKMFNTKFYHFQHEDGRKTVAAMGAHSLPSHISDKIDMVSGLSYFPIPHHQAIKSTVTGPNGSTDAYIPQSLRSLYNIPYIAPGAWMNQTQGVIEFQGENFDQPDLTAWGQQVNINVQTVPQAQIIGPNDPTNPQTEAILDIEFIAGTNPGVNNYFWLEQGSLWLYDWSISFFQTQQIPQVISISYGWWELDQCTIDTTECGNLGINSYQYVQRVNLEFQKIALRGVSMLVSSGDSGANGRTNGDCSNPQLRAAYPSSSPYVTSVGATQVNNPSYMSSNLPAACNGQGYACVSGVGAGQEVAVSYAVASFASGGGFSNIAPTPSYQKAAVANYFKSGVQLPPASYFNVSGRGAPDVSAIGYNCLIYQGGLTPVGGTSCAAPIVASTIGVLNNYMLGRTGKPLGFLNQLFYKMEAECPLCFRDITVGDNICTEQGCSGCQGFYAAKGWDPVTGLGSPNVGAQINYLKSKFGH